MTILPLLFAGIILLLKKAVFLGKFAMFITGLLGVGNALSLGQFGGINSFHQPNRPFGGNRPFGTFGDSFGNGGLNGGLSGGYYKSTGSAPITFNEFAITEKDPQYVDQFYNFEKKFLQNKSEKVEKEPKVSTEQSERLNSYRNFKWQSS